jgi:hypothetical protein
MVNKTDIIPAFVEFIMGKTENKVIHSFYFLQVIIGSFFSC